MKEYKLKINNNPYTVQINSVEGKIANVTVNGVEYSVELENEVAAPAAPAAQAVQAPVQAAPAAQPSPAPAAGGKDVTSPLPGVILSVNVAVGDKVAAGQKVAVLEAMKMENDIEAETAGTVTAIHVQKGESVLEGAKIVTIA